MTRHHLPEFAGDLPYAGDVTLTEFQRWENGLGNVLLGFTSGGSGVVTFRGLQALTSTPLALLLACTTVALAFAVGRFLCSQYPRGDGDTKTTLLRRIALPGALLLGLTSTGTGIIGLTMVPAKEYAHVQLVDEAELRLQSAEQAALKDHEVRERLSVLAVEWNELADDERDRGRFYKKGAGTVYGGILGLARAFEGSEDALEDAERRRRNAAARAAKATAAMRAIVDQAEQNEAGMRESSRLLAKQLRDYNRAMAELQRSPVGSVLLSLETAKEQQASATLTARKSKQRARERAAKEAVAEMAESAIANVQEGLEETSEPLTPERPLRVPLVMEAIADQFPRVLPLVGFVVALDLFLPLFVILALAHLRSRLVRRVPAQPSSKVTVREVPTASPTAKLADIQERLRRHRDGA